MKRILFLAAMLVTLLGTAAAQAPQMPQLPLDPGVRKGTLPNGLTYYIRHNEWPEKRVDFYIAQKVGSIQEEENQRGLAHFLEHMCFNGTTHFPGDGLKQYLERIGVKFGENLNAYTAFDETVYNINNVNVEVAGAIDSCLLILHDWSCDLLLQDKEIDKERGVINEEWRMRRTAMMRMQEEAFRTLYKGSRYAERMPIGTMDVVMNFPYEALRDYYHRWYRPDLQAIVVVGDVDVDQMEQKIKALFAPIAPAAPDAPKREYYPVGSNEKPLVAIQKDKEQTRPLAIMMFKTPAVPREVKSTLPYMVVPFMKSAVANMMNDRLLELIRQPNPPFEAGNVAHEEYLVAKTLDAVNATVVLKDGEYLKGLAAIYREVLRAKRFGFTETEYARFKQEYLSQLDAAYAARDKVSNTAYVQEYVRHFLDNEPAPGIEWEYQNMKTLIEQIPLQLINQQWFPQTEMGRAIALFLPEKEGSEYPTEQQILDMMAAVEAEDIQGFVEEVNTDPLVPEITDYAAVKSIKPDAYGARLITLQNGIRIHVLQTDYSPNKISMKASSWGGSSLYPNQDYLVASNASMVSLGGWGTFSALELQKKLAGIQASVQPTVGDRAEGLDGSCVKKDFETLLQLTYLCFTAPHRDDETFQSSIERLRNRLANQDLNPQSALSDSVASVVYRNNVRAKRLRVADLDALDYDRILQIYGERFANAADFEFYFVGDLNADSVAPLLSKYLGALPTQKGREKYKKTDNTLSKGELTCLFEKEQDTPNSVTLFLYHGKMKDNLRNDIVLSMLQQAMQMHYTESVREEEGGAYGVPVGASLSDYPEPVALIQIQLPTSPDKQERMMQKIYEGVDYMVQQGPSAENLQKIKEYMLRSHTEDLKSNAYWMRNLFLKTRYGLEKVEGYEEIVNAITVEDLKAMARKVFKSGNRIVVGMSTPKE